MKKLIFVVLVMALVSCGDSDNSHDHIGVINGTLSVATGTGFEKEIVDTSGRIEIDATSSATIKAGVRKAMKWAYFEGQKDYSEGDVRIQKNGNGEWEWTNSCWD